MRINELVQKAHENAKNKGFWDEPRRETGTLIALIHSEVTEALDAETCAEFCEELADICIRVFDLCGGYNIDLEGVLQDPELLEDFKLNTSSFTALEKWFSIFPFDLNDNKHAISVHSALSRALESDRKGLRKEFENNIATVLICTLVWAAHKGYRIEPELLAKMEKNSQRPKMHGKRY